jgi:PhnB protein
VKGCFVKGLSTSPISPQVIVELPDPRYTCTLGNLGVKDMSVLLNPYLNFEAGKTREAMEFYKSVFGGDLTVTTFADQMGDQAQPGEENNVMHSTLATPNGLTLMAADSTGFMEYKAGTNINLSLGGDDQELLSGYFHKLAEGGNVMQPLEAAPWGDTFGMCIDKYGIQWLVNIAPSKSDS